LRVKALGARLEHRARQRHRKAAARSGSRFSR
jgi:hypothetical protein